MKILPVETEKTMISSSAILSSLAPSPEVDHIYSDEVLIGNMVEIEKAYLSAQSQLGMISAELAQSISQALTGFQFDATKIREGAKRDGVVVPELVRQMREFAAPKIQDVDRIHKGLTSQDVVDTSFAMAYQSLNDIYETKLKAILSALTKLQDCFGSDRIMGRTRMQAALEISVADRLRTWRAPIEAILRNFPAVRENLEVVTLGGPVGDGRAWGDQSTAVAEEMARLLGLHPNNNQQTNRIGLHSYGTWLVQLTGQGGKIGMDIALMAQQGINEVKLGAGGASSAMTHKSNPIAAETLVSLARYSSTLIAGLSQALIHEQERSGASWTLEWMCMSQICASAEASLITLCEVLNSIEVIGQN